MKDIIELAKEAGFVGFGPVGQQKLERFAALVRAEALAEPVKQEPVACDGDFPEGFDASLGIPAQALRAANAVMFDLINKREWDVPCTAEHIRAYASKYAAPVDAKVIRAEALEEAAKVCDEYENRLEGMRDSSYQAELAGRQMGAFRCAAAIRGLK